MIVSVREMKKLMCLISSQIKFALFPILQWHIRFFLLFYQNYGPTESDMSSLSKILQLNIQKILFEHLHLKFKFVTFEKINRCFKIFLCLAEHRTSEFDLKIAQKNEKLKLFLIYRFQTAG